MKDISLKPVIFIPLAFFAIVLIYNASSIKWTDHFFWYECSKIPIKDWHRFSTHLDLNVGILAISKLFHIVFGKYYTEWNLMSILPSFLVFFVLTRFLLALGVDVKLTILGNLLLITNVIFRSTFFIC